MLYMNDEGVIFRFLEYDYINEEGKYECAKFLAGMTMKVTFDRFLNFIKSAIGLDIKIKDKWYTVDEITLNYNGNEEDMFCVNIYCIGY